MSSPFTVIVAGVAGRMGREVARLAADAPDIELAGGLEARDHPVVGKKLSDLGVPSDAPIAGDIDELAGARRVAAKGRTVLIEFCLGAGAIFHARCAAERGIAVVSGSTGLSPEMADAFRALGATIPVVRSPNFSRGALALIHHGAGLVKTLGNDYDVEIVESHHRGKRDVPSGTALALAEAVAHARGTEPGRLVSGRRSGEPSRAPGEIGIHGVRGGTIPGEHRLLIAGDGETIEVIHRVFGREAFARGALHAARLALSLAPGYYEGPGALVAPSLRNVEGEPS